MRIAALDLGSNTFLCLICELVNNSIEKVLSDEVKVVRLGQGLAQNKFFHPEALKRADECLAQFSKTITEYKVEKIVAVATAAARDAQNGGDLFAIGKKYNIPIQIIEGSREAEITYAGAISGIQDQSSVAVIDIGGGSTELIYGRNGKIDYSQSVNLGCVKVRETILDRQIDKANALQKIETLASHFSAITEQIRQQRPQKLVAVAGTPTSLAACELGGFDAQKIDGFILTFAKIEKWIEVFCAQTPEQIAQNWPIDPGRADVILSGTLLLWLNLKLLGLSELTVSTRGVRYGVALKMF